MFDFEYLKRLESLSHFKLSSGKLESLSEEAKRNLEILVIRSKTKVTEELLRMLPNLKWIISCTAGFDHIDLRLFPQFPDLQVCHTPSAHTSSAAELTWALLLACVRKLEQAQSSIRLGQWDRSPLIGTELSEKTIGIVGLGRIGSRVAQIAQSFNMKVVAFDPYQEDSQFHSVGAARLSFQELLISSDVVTFHVPSSRETKKMLKASNLQDLAHGIILINTSRGDIIDPDLLNEGLKKGYIKALGLDVHYREPLPIDTPYLNHPNCVATPHIGAQTSEALKKVSAEAVKKIELIVSGQNPGDTLPPRALWYTSPMGFVDG
jgi:D-3-phosphoglycerate dehydrogenase